MKQLTAINITSVLKRLFFRVLLYMVRGFLLISSFFNDSYIDFVYPNLFGFDFVDNPLRFTLPNSLPILPIPKKTIFLKTITYLPTFPLIFLPGGLYSLALLLGFLIGF